MPRPKHPMREYSLQRPKAWMVLMSAAAVQWNARTSTSVSMLRPVMPCLKYSSCSLSSCAMSSSLVVVVLVACWACCDAWRCSSFAVRRRFRYRDVRRGFWILAWF